MPLDSIGSTTHLTLIPIPLAALSPTGYFRHGGTCCGFITLITNRHMHNFDLWNPKVCLLSVQSSPVTVPTQGRLDLPPPVVWALVEIISGPLLGPSI